RREMSLGWVYRDYKGSARAVAPSREKSKRSTAVRRSATFAGTNVHFLAASSEMRSKYLLGPGICEVTATTFPCLSTTTRIATLIVPRIVCSALGAAAGVTSSSGDGDAESDVGLD
ncbi:MAG TPA: hypothetical protein VNA21_00145, partial [Steroidobacteraceae bacterium]|nr:hypothetical protein [Steroidobacteraceae bacterium]